MNKYEILLEEAHSCGLTVKEKSLEFNDGRIKGRKIAIRKTLPTETEKGCVLAEELGHYYTSVGNIVDMSDTWNRKQERQSRLMGFNKMVGLSGLIEAYEHGCRERYEIAEYLEVTDEFLTDAVDCYRSKYGVCVTVDNYIVFFIPHMMVGKMF